MVKINTSVCGWTARNSRVASTPLRSGKLVIENGHVWLGLGGKLNGLPAVLGDGDDFPTRLASQDRVESRTGPHHVVGFQDAHRPPPPPAVILHRSRTRPWNSGRTLKVTQETSDQARSSRPQPEPQDGHDRRSLGLA